MVGEEWTVVNPVLPELSVLTALTSVTATTMPVVIQSMEGASVSLDLLEQGKN